MELVLQFIREVLMEIPGAFIRWLYFRKEKSFKEILEKERAYNVTLSFAFIAIIILAIVLLKK